MLTTGQVIDFVKDSKHSTPNKIHLQTDFSLAITNAARESFCFELP